MITIHQLILGSVLVAIIFFSQSYFRMPLIGLYFLICAYYYFSLNLNLGMYGLILFLVLLMTGIIRNDMEHFEHEHFEEDGRSSSADDDDEKGIEQFGIEDRFTKLHNLIHDLSNKNSNSNKK
jgi:hypothetical protein